MLAAQPLGKPLRVRDYPEQNRRQRGTAICPPAPPGPSFLALDKTIENGAGLAAGAVVAGFFETYLRPRF